MAKDRDLERLEFKPGDPVSAAALQVMANALVRPGFSIRSSGGINARRSSGGDVQLAYIPDVTDFPFLGKTTGAGSLRSGDVLGVYSVNEWVEDPTAGTANTFVASGATFDNVLCISSTTGGIPSGTWVVCIWLASGRAAIICVDCGN